MLSNFQLGSQGLLQSFLVGQPELRNLMQRPELQQLRQRVTASYHLGPMDRGETQAYVEHRLRHVGWKEDPRFEAGAFDAIYSFSSGIPRRINTLCNRVLLAAYLSERHVVNMVDVKETADEMKQEMADGARAGAPGGMEGGPLPGPVLSNEPNRSLEERVVRLERTMNATLNFLQQIVRPGPSTGAQDQVKS